MIKINYEYLKNGEHFFGQYMFDDEIAKYERVPITDNYRIELFLKSEFPNSDIIIIDNTRLINQP